MYSLSDLLIGSPWLVEVLVGILLLGFFAALFMRKRELLRACIVTFGVVFLTLVVVWLVWWRIGISPETRVIATLVTVGGLELSVLLTVNYRKQAVREAHLIQNRFLESLALLDKPDSPISRLAGVQGLLSLADNHPNNHQPVVDALCGYLRTPRTDDGLVETTILQALTTRLLKARFKQSGLGGVKQLVKKHQLWCECNINLSGITFTQPVDFSFLTFNGQVYFEDVIFEQDVDFVGARFNELVQFRETNFMGEANFEAAKFKEYASFRKVNFTKVANFKDTKFLCPAYFFGANFADLARFWSTEFAALAFFVEARFEDIAYFGHAVFEDEANFSETQFRHLACFEDARFAGNVNFGVAEFSGIVNFGDADFAEDANFVKAKFSRVYQDESVLPQGFGIAR